MRWIWAHGRNRAAVKYWAGSLMLALATAQAADSDSAAQDQWPGYEVTPFLGLSLGGAFNVDDDPAANGPSQHVNLDDRVSFAVALDFRADELAQYEFFYGRESTVLRGDASFSPTPVVIEYVHFGGLVLLNEETPLKPYLAGGLGLTRLDPQAPGNSDTRFSGSAALGLRWPVSRHFAVRLEARGLATLVSADTSTFCRSDQAGLLCHVRGRGQGFFQGMLLAGAAISF